MEKKKETVEKVQPKEIEKPIEMTKAQIEKKDNEDELAVKLTQYEQNKSRMTGSFSQRLGRAMGNIHKEIKQAETIIEMQEIQIERDTPLNPKYGYETHPRWRELNHIGMKEVLENNRIHLKTLNKQKEEITAEQPILKKRINELEKLLGKNLTKFE